MPLTKRSLFEPRQVENTRDRIIKAFSKCIHEKGIASVSLRTIAQKAGVSLGTVHYYFRSRENLITQTIEYELDFIANDIQRRFNSSDSPERKLRAICEEGRDFAQTELQIAFFEIWTASMRNKIMKKSFASFYTRLSDLISAVIREGKQQGIFRDVPEDLVANSIIAMVEGAGLQCLMRGKAVCHFAETFDLMVESVMDYLKINKTAPNPLPAKYTRQSL
ncbi:MAG TPA: TetR/AcrR family transcriptional regulator [Thermodesulfobacteriota bacterium]|nr:TetR/AcrR family transcriptional regulator [Deltaproteobacteria bacterium]HNR12401.1 TetR/AcrR family transcriptional regulator [Thermodesulfobacteriota bacterium]HNU70912.1 TetR/AcrR family transcriptional regulator [Thermodesulfobacteriota bacterium]